MSEEKPKMQRLTKKWLAEQKIKLQNTMEAIAHMDRETLFAEIPKTCGFKPNEHSTDAELRVVLIRWAIHDAIPGNML